MMRLWDYFMRRKILLLFVVAAFAASSVGSYQLLHSRIKTLELQYITIRDWGNSEIEVPATGGVMPWIAVMQPHDVVAIVRSEPTRDDTMIETDLDKPDNDQAEEVEGEQAEDEIRENTENQNPEENLDNLDDTGESDSQIEDPNIEENNDNLQNPDSEIANEDLENLEQPALPDSAVLEVLPPDQQMSDEVLDSAINSVNPENPTASISQPETMPRRDNWFDLLTVLQSIIVIGFSGYLAYWHFRR